MKKFLSILFVLSMLVLLMTGLVSAQTGEAVATYTFSDVSGNPGEEVAVQFSLKTGTPVNTIGVKDFVYDSSALELVRFEKADGFEVALCEYDASKQVLAIATFESKSVDAVVGSFVFKIKESAVPGESFPVSATTIITKNSSDSYGSDVYEGSVGVLVRVTGVSLDKTSLTLEKGKTEKLTATIIPENATDKGMTWTSSDNAVATVENGVVTAVGAGTAQITVTTADGNKSASCSVVVTAPPVIDENAPAIVVSKVVSRAGNTVDVDISIKNNPGITVFRVYVDYDESLTLVSATSGGILNGFVYNANEVGKNPYTVFFKDSLATENNMANGTVVTLKFKVSDDAQEGDLPINITYEADNFDIYDKDLKPVEFAIVNGSVEIKSYIIGDMNDDGRVNPLDCSILERHLAGWEGYEAETFTYAAADLNGDGRVNPLDCSILERHLAGWGGYETLPYKS